MKLTYLIKDLDNVDQEAIIFIEDSGNSTSDSVLSFEEEGDNVIRVVDGRKYCYLIEVFLAKEFIEDWKSNFDFEQTIEKTAERLYDYALNDA